MALLVFLVLFIYDGLAAQAKPCDSLGKLGRSLESQRPVPLGMSQSQFNELLELFKTDTAFRRLDAIMLFGSRTHFTFGHPPQKDSDLDVMYVFNPEALRPNSQSDIFIQTLDQSEILDRKLKPLANKLGFKIGQEIPSFRSFEEMLSDPYFKTENLQKMQERYQKIASRAEEQGFNRIQLKGQWLTENPKSLNHNEKIFIIRQSDKSDHFKTKLEEIGYHNIWIVPSP
jgi:predicted nucleotidyltransferase